ncbi:hypothetical protein [Arthrobacter sp. QXT-31]|uniref:hypothetical protein n=1 Tax=Arthrobacter sp. QXT-31 TaxID=1357915 RepID=UPI000971A66D|nr:hypothetical protein [Arthrobacter sp. QXT-31]APX02845.1 hypothetical protein BWQ92_14990 [Arthrobacter sp. QXT-31]
MTAARSLASVFLHRAGMFSLVLALIAGIFGMHVMTGHHSMHSVSAVTGTESLGQSGHLHHAHAAGEAAAVTAGAADAGQEIPAAAGCPDGDCSGAQAMTVSCIPAGKTGSLAAPLPGTAVFAAALVRAGPVGQVSARSAHKPATPTPCDLSISRT